DDLAFRESGRLHAKFPVDPAARKFYLEHPLILGGTTPLPRDRESHLPLNHILKNKIGQI
ncbi:hypothetical protein, partial [Paraburkholderia saeva]|uniref:hypothetical protein n=1 Tax=Paraburkholderia saeva TaxID=2777537 RepID=UPI001E5A40CA